MDQAAKSTKKHSKLLYWGGGAALWAVAGVMIVGSFKSGYSSNSKVEQAFAERALASARDTMKDPTTVKFKDITASAVAGCVYGKILARNSYGAYTGYQDFVWADDRMLIDPGKIQINAIVDNSDDVINYNKAKNRCMSAMPINAENRPLIIPEA